MTAPDLSALFPAIAQGDETALAELYRHMSARLYGVALRITRRRELAAQVLTDLFVALPGDLAALRGPDGTVTRATEAWLVARTRAIALDLRRPLDGSTLPDDADALADIAAANPDAPPQLSPEIRALLARLGTLDPHRRRLLLLAYYDGFSIGELAARQGIPDASVRDWLGQCMKAIAEPAAP